MFEKIFESKEKQHARHLAWAKAHPQEMKALIRKCLPLSDHGDGLKYVAAYYAACCVWEHRWFWEDNLKVIISTHADHLLECGYHDFVFVIPSFTDCNVSGPGAVARVYGRGDILSLYHRQSGDNQALPHGSVGRATRCAMGKRPQKHEAQL